MQDLDIVEVLKNRTNTLIYHHERLLYVLNETNKEHPEYFSKQIDFGTIKEKLGNIPNTSDAVKTYIESANKIYLNTMKNYEELKDNHNDYLNEKRYIYNYE